MRIDTQRAMCRDACTPTMQQAIWTTLPSVSFILLTPKSLKDVALREREREVEKESKRFGAISEGFRAFLRSVTLPEVRGNRPEARGGSVRVQNGPFQPIRDVSIGFWLSSLRSTCS
ncbi:hypothetical protein F2Q69_00014404 [Brassica cretica]|uniref:Uncharacterized protein n=1 Tax=Brassica cretica TaxID=69181 RepID=A0A8S9R7T9_BRACR|nr:hypothetical protein F2Q69_00014404 [Brassica cretica]